MYLRSRCLRENCNICGPMDCAYFVSGRRTVFMYDVPNKRKIDCMSQRQQTSSFQKQLSLSKQQRSKAGEEAEEIIQPTKQRKAGHDLLPAHHSVASFGRSTPTHYMSKELSVRNQHTCMNRSFQKSKRLAWTGILQCATTQELNIK